MSSLEHLAAQAIDAQSDAREAVAYVMAMMETTLVLTDGRRIKMLPLGWDGLSPAEAIASQRALRHAIAQERRGHPDAPIHLEISCAPDYLVEFMESLGREDRNLTYAVVSDLTP